MTGPLIVHMFTSVEGIFILNRLRFLKVRKLNFYRMV